jgi:hypothetical protein
MANRNNSTSVNVRIPSARQIRGGLAVALAETAKDFVKSTVDKMAKSKPRGRVYYSKRKGFHRASAPGQRPAIDTTTLYKAVAYKVDRNQLEAVAFIKPLPNPENGVTAERYAEILQTQLNRKIMTKRDASEFKKVLAANVQKVANRIK